MELLDDGIVCVIFKKGSVVDIKEQDENLNAFVELAGAQKRPILYRAEHNVTFTREARERAPELEKRTPVSASAFLANNLAYKLMADFYIKFNKPFVPSKTFRKEDEAIKWLKQYL